MESIIIGIAGDSGSKIKSCMEFCPYAAGKGK